MLSGRWGSTLSKRSTVAQDGAGQGRVMTTDRRGPGASGSARCLRGASVGDLIDVELADVRAVLRAVDEQAGAMAGGHPGATDAYAQVLDAAQVTDAWDADRRVDLALNHLAQ